MHSLRLALSGLAAICVISCNSPEYLSEADLQQYISGNDDLSKSVTCGDIRIRATCKPTDLLVAQELGNMPDPPVEQISRARAKYSDQYYFTISFSRSGEDLLKSSALGTADFRTLLQTMAFRMSDVVSLTTSRHDTIPVSDYAYNRTFGLSSSTDLLFVFDKAKARDQEWIQINIDEFGLGIGKQVIRFHVHDLENTPKIYKL